MGPLFIGSILNYVNGVQQGNSIRVQTSLLMALQRLGRSVITTLLITLFAVIFILILMVPIGILIPLLAHQSTVQMWLSSLYGVGALILTLWIFVKLSLVFWVCFSEGSIGWIPISRSWSLTRNHFWKTAGILFFSSIFSGMLTAFLAGIFNLIFPENPIISTSLLVLVDMVFAPIPFIAMTNLFIDLTNSAQQVIHPSSEKNEILK